MRHARANGGYLIHALPAGAFTSLCGHTPKQGAFRMRQRGKWLVYGDGVAPVSCKKCLAALAVVAQTTEE